LYCVSAAIAAVTMRLPRNANPNVALLAGASPNQESLEQYLRKQW
jgi:hypothetical protein